MPKPSLSIKTTSLCNLRCKHCSVIPWMDANPNWHTSLEDIEKLIKYSRDAGYMFDFLLLSGGEPLLWKNVVEGTKLIKQAGIMYSLVFLTNGIALFDDLDKVFEIISYVNVFRIARYERNTEIIKRFLEVIRDKPFSHKVMIEDRKDHFISPTEPIPNSLPAECFCDAYAMSNGCIDICGPSRCIAHRQGWNLNDSPEMSTPISENFLDYFKNEDRFNKKWCQYCIANKKVSSAVEVYHNE